MLAQTYTEWSGDNATTHGAALAYYTIFSLSPLVIIAAAIAGFLFGREAAEGAIVRQIEDTVGPRTAEALQELVASTRKPFTGIAATVVGIITLLFGATAVFGQLQQALDRIWKVPADPNRGFTGLLKDRFVSFTMVLGIGFLLLVSLLISTALSAIGQFIDVQFAGTISVLSSVNAFVSFAIITILFAMMYRILPERTILWRNVWLGAIITAAFFNAGKQLIALYLSHSSVTSTFGAAGSLVLILVWVYYSSQIFLFGAEFTYVFTKFRGTQRPIERKE